MDGSQNLVCSLQFLPLRRLLKAKSRSQSQQVGLWSDHVGPVTSRLTVFYALMNTCEWDHGMSRSTLREYEVDNQCHPSTQARRGCVLGHALKDC